MVFRYNFLYFESRSLDRKNKNCIFIVSFQTLTRRLRFRLQKASGDTSLVDRTGRSLKMEPLSTVAQLERYLLKMVAKQWYDNDRSTFVFVNKLKEPNVRLQFRHQYDFDENGVIYWIGTNAK